jgi:lathosterol oxidase
MTLAEKLRHALEAGWAYALANLAWYGVAAGVVWLGFYVLWRTSARRRKIVPRIPSYGQQGWELLHSLQSLLVFGAVAGVIAFAWMSGYPTKAYRRVDEYGWGWYVATLVIAIVVHDAYFYWTHRLLHLPVLFRRVHRVHHLSNNPTPWAAYSFSAGEAFVQAGIGPLLLYTIPMHYSAFVAFMAWQIAFNVVGHCGYEIFPRWFLKSWAGKFLNTPTHHAMHHEKVGANFGLYFNVWDRLLGTNHPDYESRFATVTAATAEDAAFASGAGSAHPAQRLR